MRMRPLPRRIADMPPHTCLQRCGYCGKLVWHDEVCDAGEVAKKCMTLMPPVQGIITTGFLAPYAPEVR